MNGKTSNQWINASEISVQMRKLDKVPQAYKPTVTLNHDSREAMETSNDRRC